MFTLDPRGSVRWNGDSGLLHQNAAPGIGTDGLHGAPQIWKVTIPMISHRIRSTFTAIAFMVLAVLGSSVVDAAPVAVRFPEGLVHGYLLVRSLDGEKIGQGELTQVVKKGGLVESHLVFRFKDGSLHDETVTFSQKGVFTMIHYHLIQRGPLFPEQVEASIDRGTAKYKVRSSVGKEGKEEALTGKFDLPKDVYNGMLVVVLKNLLKGANETVNVLAFTPEPQAIPLELLIMDEQTVHIGDLSTKATRYVFKPQIGMIRGFLGKIAGKLPADLHYDCWIVTGEVPSFVQIEGPLQLMGPILRIELVSPRLSAKPQGKRIAEN
jgi:hypothetical protein